MLVADDLLWSSKGVRGKSKRGRGEIDPYNLSRDSNWVLKEVKGPLKWGKRLSYPRSCKPIGRLNRGHLVVDANFFVGELGRG